MPQTHYLTAWLTSGSQTVRMGILPVGAYVVRVHVHCTVAFNSDGTDNVTMGYTGTTNAYATSTDVSTTGIKAPTLGAGAGFDGTAREVNAYYVNGGTEASAGKALCIIEYFIAPRSP